MAEFIQKIFKENITKNGSETLKRVPVSMEGTAVAYTSLIIMAVVPVFFGSLKSVKHHKEQSEYHKGSGGKPETITKKDAAMFPLHASIALFGLYLFFELFSKEYINLLLTAYFFVLGVMSLSHLTKPILSSLIPPDVPNILYHLKLTERKGTHLKMLISYEFTTYDVICVFCSSLAGAWYVIKKHWIINNIFGLAFAVNGVELLHLNNMVTGCILLCGLFVYDIFWVFGTRVMVTVAKSFEAPVKLLFPQDLFEKGLNADNFAMLGLGDIVIPGIFIALLLRFDNSLKRNSKTYFYATFTAYFLSLVATVFVMHLYKHAQPALLYVVPACLGTALTMALVRGDIGTMFHYEDLKIKEACETKKSENCSTEVTSSSKVLQNTEKNK